MQDLEKVIKKATEGMQDLEKGFEKAVEEAEGFKKMTDKEVEEATITTVDGIPKEELESEEYTVEVEKLEEEAKAAAALESLRKKEPTVKIGRNEKCPCGSGKKFKRCCEGKISNRQPVSIMSQRGY